MFTKPFKNGMSLAGPEVAILGADQKERDLWGREWVESKMHARNKPAKNYLAPTFSTDDTRAGQTSRACAGNFIFTTIAANLAI